MIDENDDYENIKGRTYISQEKKEAINLNTFKKEEKTIKKPINNITFYTSTVLCSILFYLIFAYIGNISIMELVDMELPILVILSLAITWGDINKKMIESYIVMIILAVIVYQIVPPYAFIIIVSILSKAVVDCIIRIFTNDKDYTTGFKTI